MNFGLDNALLIVIKLLFIIGGGLYFLFSFVVIRQITIMKKTLITTLEPEISLLGWIHLLLVLGLFLYFILWM
ncbi:MAG: hypothetical protein A2383_00800 [Candidatus Pacebacteria bacterium RIFOXYB1_FULL_39_46]|nr:MAG: hypothetical protein A2182_00635 [Candidatus Pacebacteria bacterium RIFOXYA1_FULL_38_18]OGJ38122.1 MAG: hypothetical protein A2383_00800 [Candidatus Pacebacteria bacterium RIFOXYB1_FULL_39_46]OGJ39656.1 MAG: hypothetical protein A2411_02640 [Candidatus Pacebacteria bacterium RIFOXYC1_FULL_39_21]OGJ39874.1 MAG: hypothetical protein A2582_00565 [Candidatus Pacebacteria bacterium RIFOXYD1_FULL_39_27]